MSLFSLHYSKTLSSFQEFKTSLYCREFGSVSLNHSKFKVPKLEMYFQMKLRHFCDTDQNIHIPFPSQLPNYLFQLVQRAERLHIENFIELGGSNLYIVIKSNNIILYKLCTWHHSVPIAKYDKLDEINNNITENIQYT